MNWEKFYARLIGSEQVVENQVKQCLASIGLKGFLHLGGWATIPFCVQSKKHFLSLNIRGDELHLHGLGDLSFANDLVPEFVDDAIKMRNRQLDGFAWRLCPNSNRLTLGVVSVMQIIDLSAEKLRNRMASMVYELEYLHGHLDRVRHQLTNGAISATHSI